MKRYTEDEDEVAQRLLAYAESQLSEVVEGEGVMFGVVGGQEREGLDTATAGTAIQTSHR